MSVEHDEHIASDTALLEHAVAGAALDDVAASETALRFLLGEAVERREVSIPELAEGPMDIAPVGAGLGQSLAQHVPAAGDEAVDTGGDARA